MTRVHSLQEIERLGATDFAHDDAFRPHAKAVLDEVAHRHLAFAFDVRRAGFKSHDMRLLQLEFGCVLTGDNSFPRLDVTGQTIEQCRLS